MKKSKVKYPETEWKKSQTRPCPGTCGHLHVAKTGPCTRIGCGCSASKKKVR